MEIVRTRALDQVERLTKSWRSQSLQVFENPVYSSLAYKGGIRLSQSVGRRCSIEYSLNSGAHVTTSVDETSFGAQYAIGYSENLVVASIIRAITTDRPVEVRGRRSREQEAIIQVDCYSNGAFGLSYHEDTSPSVDESMTADVKLVCAELGVNVVHPEAGEGQSGAHLGKYVYEMLPNPDEIITATLAALDKQPGVDRYLF